MNKLIKKLPNHKKYNEILNLLKTDKEKISITGINENATSHLIYSFTWYLDSSSIIIVSSSKEAKKITENLKFYSDIEVLYFPHREINYYDFDAESTEVSVQRMNVINKILENKKVIVVTTIDAIMEKVLPKKSYKDSNININVNDKLDIEKLSEKLVNLGYERSALVEGKGQFALRGGIVDIFDISADNPVRIELFGDEVESIRSFDVLTQRSIQNLQNINIYMSHEFMTKEYINYMLENSENKNLINKNFNNIFKETDCLLSYFDNPKIYIVEPTRVIAKARNIKFENEEIIKDLIIKKYVKQNEAYSLYSFEDIEKNILNNVNVYIEKINIDRLLNIKRKEIIFSSREVNFFRSMVDPLIKDVTREKITSLLVFPSHARVEQIYNLLLEKNIKVTKIDDVFDERFKYDDSVYITFGNLSSGFYIEELNFQVITEETENISKKTVKKNNYEMINSFEDLVIGDFVVHENHGIGIYKGLETVKVEGVISEYIKIEFANNSNIFIPIASLDKVKKYIADSDKKPKLSSLSSKEWTNTKNKVKKHVEEVAKEIVMLYAKRESMHGYACEQDNYLQKEFEDTFLYELTEDQEISINEIKKDMEEDKPMDRLLCGDVGYGKTEVALRAAFKAVMNNKQVIYLVPTTVLCMQQYNTFKDRMEKFSVNVEMLSRFRSKKEQNEILKKLVDGKVDVLVSTHRGLSSDVFFKDLGLLIIDEEHRFGAMDKEKIKLIKNTVDVLALTATPIPRTLHMSLVGIRGYSTLNSPPIDRIPVHTFVCEYDDNIIATAIDKELDRNGQVFYISNRVENIEEISIKVKNLCKDAKVAFAHGKMTAKEIEDIMFKFINHEIDVLVCTTILESGIDIPNANTIIIENADRLGLAQLYQIRGRVGRTNKLAYAYITYPKQKQISEASTKRLKAIADFTEFGSGFKIALRDLEIRGAGNILGKAQSGHMAMVGYDLYLSMLQKAIEFEKTGKEDIEFKDVKIELPVSSYIPDTYITNVMQKIAIYQKLSDTYDNSKIIDIVDELLDRYGPIPTEVNNLIKIVEIRNIARKYNINRITLENSKVAIFRGNDKVHFYTNKSDLLLEIYTFIKNMANLNSM